MKIVIINGRPGVGKDEFVKCCQNHYHWCLNISTVDFVKEVARICGWNGEKTLKNRAFLSDLKFLLTEWNDVPYQKVKHEIDLFRCQIKNFDFNPEEEGIVFVHCREPEEIARFCNEMDAVALLIRRPIIEYNETSNAADEGVFDFNYDYTIVNDGTLVDLDNTAIDFLQKMGITNLK